jgi:superfamily II DNA helicase RecQ
MEGTKGQMADAFHWQASHNPSVGNRTYGGTVNFRGSLTDAGLQEYIRISQMWHEFLLFDVEDKPGAKYKIAKQEEAVQAVVSGLFLVMAILRTEEGKSVLYMLPQRLPGAGTTVLVVPLVVLKQDTVRRCEMMGIGCRVWGEEARYGLGNSLVIVSLDQAVGTSFQTYLHRLEVAGQLNSMVFDESHLILTASGYREKMEKVKLFRKLGCQLVFLTATLPVCMVKWFTERLLLLKPVVIRGLSVRKDIQYDMKQRAMGTEKMMEVAVETIKEALELEWFAGQTEDRAIVYCRTKRQVEEVGAGLGCPVYYSDSGTEEEKGDVLRGWIEGKTQILVATSAFGAGIDYGHVRMVFHAGESSGAIDFAQEVGRGGRDGEGSFSRVILPSGWKAKSRDIHEELAV